MSDPQDRAEALDEDKSPWEPNGEMGTDLIDQTADANPGQAEAGQAEIDDGESGDEIEGREDEDEPDRAADPYRAEEPSPEVAAIHIREQR